MQNCCHKCHSTEGLKMYDVTEDGHIVSEEKAREIRTMGRFFSIGLAKPFPRIEYSFFFCPKCAKSGKAS